MTIKLTNTQAEVLVFVRHHKRFHGDTPTLQQISEAFGWKSINSAEQHIHSLVAKNFLIRERHSLRIVDPDYCEHCGGRG